MEVSTIHSLGVQCYSLECCRDEGLKRVVQDNMTPSSDRCSTASPFDVVVIDECQDFRPCMKIFLDKFLKDFQLQKCQFVILGDRYQALYQYADADERFLTFAPKPEVFGYLNSYPWERVIQRTTNRLTPQIVKFLNELIIKGKFEGTGSLISARRDQDAAGTPYPRPIMYSGNPYKDPFRVYEKCYITPVDPIPPQNIMILAPSTSSPGSPIHDFVNKVASTGIPVHVPRADVEDVGHLADNKLLVCTYHQSKGLERPEVFAFGTDSTYLQYFDRNPASLEYANNAMYVALSRAKSRLIMFRDYKAGHLPYINIDSLTAWCNVVELRSSPRKRKDQPHSEQKTRYSVSQLLLHLPDHIIEECLSYLHMKQIVPPGLPQKRHLVPVIQDKFGHNETVSDITGTASATIHQVKQKRGFSLLWAVRKAILEQKKRPFTPGKVNIPEEHLRRIDSILAKWKDKREANTSDILFVAGVHSAITSGYVYKLLTIPPEKYDWLTEEAAEDIFWTIHEHVPRGSQIVYEKLDMREISIRVSEETDEHRNSIDITLLSIPDICILGEEGNRIIECKHTELLSPIDVIQAAIYGGLSAASYEAHYDSLLLNLRTGQGVEVSPKTNKSFMKILELLVRQKLDRRHNTGDGRMLNLSQLTDQDFLRENREGFPARIGRVSLPTWFFMKPTESKSHMRMARMKGRDFRKQKA